MGVEGRLICLSDSPFNCILPQPTQYAKAHVYLRVLCRVHPCPLEMHLWSRDEEDPDISNKSRVFSSAFNHLRLLFIFYFI
ncbi:Uncharacterized protein TCM_000004 [Theobroma cacao]|uniref:Uncharacterized protein n=1 Tax=Theobroma cacao TaxID=3641 RepID=A0A061DF05_THECC|nr:Uncharacterized protein TCM_000004 [Theobroma cacao]